MLLIKLDEIDFIVPVSCCVVNSYQGRLFISNSRILRIAIPIIVRIRNKLTWKILVILCFHVNCPSVPERSTRRTWEQPVSFSLPVDDVRMEQRMKFDGGRFEYTDPKESTRRFR